MNIHLLTDSLGGPRLNKISKVYFNNTWIDKIIHSFNQHKISYLVRHSLNTNHIVNNQDKYILPYNSDLTFIQVGIVDCFPRVFLYNERSIISKLPLSIGTKFILPFSKKYYKTLTSLIKRNEVSFQKFIYNINYLSSNYKIQYIPIIPPCDDYLAICPNAEFFVEKYNSVLGKHSCNQEEFISFLNFLKRNRSNLVIEDYHHLNNYGHNCVYQYVFNFLSSL